MTAARPQDMKRVFTRWRISPPWSILCIRVALSEAKRTSVGLSGH
jgi:hypothetical protein